MTKFKQVEMFLREKINSGEWASGSKIPTVRQLIKDLNASDSTVLRALRELAEQGLIVKRQGDGTYISDNFQNTLSQKKTLNFGLLWNRQISMSSFEINYRRSIVEGILSTLNIPIESVVQNHKPGGATRLSWKTKDGLINVDIIGESKDHSQLHPPLIAIQELSYDGLIALGITNQSWLKKLLMLKIPTVIVDFPNNYLLPYADHLVVDPEAGFSQATQSYIDQGYQKIHFVGECIEVDVPDSLNENQNVPSLKKEQRINPDSALRQFAVEQTLKQNGRVLEDHQIHMTNPQNDLHTNVVNTLLNLPDDKKPDVVICHNQYVAQLIVSAFRKRNLPLVGVGVTNIYPKTKEEDFIYADMNNLGKIAIELLQSKLSQPSRSFLNVGMPMAFFSKLSQKLEMYSF